MKIGMLTSGGDCQSLNAAMRGVAKTLYNNTNDVEIYGFLDGYKGMITKNYKLMKEEAETVHIRLRLFYRRRV